MSTKFLQWNHINIQDKNGILRSLRGCPIFNLGELETIVKQLWEALAEYPDVAIIDIVHNSEEIRNLHTRALHLCGIESEWLDVDMVVQLLHQYSTEAGVQHYGLLIEQNLSHLCILSADSQLLNEELEKTYQVLDEASKTLEEMTNASPNNI